jgi:hypothetical protein
MLRALAIRQRSEGVRAIRIQVREHRRGGTGDRRLLVSGRHLRSPEHRHAEQGELPRRARRVRPVRCDLGELDVDPARDRIGPISGSRLLLGAREHEKCDDDRDGDQSEPTHRQTIVRLLSKGSDSGAASRPRYGDGLRQPSRAVFFA